MTERDLRAYLLGQVSDEEAVRLEGQLLEDDDLFQTLESIEDDLFDDHARGRLEPADRAGFERRYGADGERHRFARLLSARVDNVPGVVTFRPRPVWRRWAPLAAAAAVVLAVAGIMMTRRAAPATYRAAAARAPQPVPAPAGKTAVFALTLATSRAPADPLLLTVSSDASRIQLRVRVNPADRFDAYSMDLRSPASDAIVWHAADLHAAEEAGDLVIAGTAPAASIPDGTYELDVRASTEDLGFVALKVVR